MKDPRVFLITEPTMTGAGFIPNFENANDHGELVVLLGEGYKASKAPARASDFINQKLIDSEYNPESDFLLWVNFADIHNYLTAVAVIASNYNCTFIRTLAWAKGLDTYVPINIYK